MSARHLAGRPRAGGGGLPGRLPEGETLLWQGAPDARTLLVRVFHVRIIAAYFALLIAASAYTAAHHGASAHAVGLVVLHRAGLAAALFVLVGAYAWALQRSTTYSITSSRVVVSAGIALPVSFNLPFASIAAAGLRTYGNAAGDLTLGLLPGEKLSYFVMWPHARPWRMARTEPMLRCIPDAEAVSAILAEALAAHAQAHPAATATPRREVRLANTPGRGRMVRA